MTRQELILDWLERQGACGYQELADMLGVSTMTVRREIDRLASSGAVIKTPGGAQKPTAPPTYYETALSSRLSVHVREKLAIATKALELISSGQTIFLDPGTTSLALAKLIAKRRTGVTIVTNSALACLELGRGGGNTVIGIGGQYDVGSGSFIGSASEEGADRFFVDRAFVSTKAFLPTEGTFESVIETIRMKQIIARRCAELVLLADHSKFGLRALCKALDVSQIHTIVTDSEIDEPDRHRLEFAGKTVLVASLESARKAGVSHAP
jgi:DeoR/GlpR family transcriptional regulator of sugar metabolism